ncbi:unnamed protein product [Cylicocyclus nassatus]|uniref:Uncharacterized protein n=1 Tax=Cylicocyclus nassatus TaxID=53992 RepID=A0AA36GUV6_CYLNA|nr:unnamed protein product [Cylicocyclus nassatus]
MLVDRDKILELMNTAEPLRQGIGARGNPLAARVSAMEEMIKNLTELKPLKESDTTLEVAPSSSRAASTKSTKRQISSSSDTSESDAENKKHAAEKPGPSKTSTPKKAVKLRLQERR